MPGKKAIHNISNKNPQSAATAAYEVPSYENHPFFVKKAEKAKKFIEKVGLPKAFTERHKI